MLQILIAVFAFGVIIMIHELGHFCVAKSVGITVHEFAIGMGPKIFSKKRGETLYALRLIPIGGFVQMEGEDEDSDDPGAFSKKKVWQRVLVVVAGAAMNILLGFLILFGLTAASDGLSSTTVAVFNDGATSSQALRVGDRITRVGGARVHIGSDVVFELMQGEKTEVDMEVVRGGETVKLENVPFQTKTADDGTLLVTLDFKVYPVEKTPLNVLKYAAYWTKGTVHQVWASLVGLVTGRYGLKQLSGPVGVTAVIGEAASIGLEPVLSLLAMITINIGIFNLLPIPALDGGRLVFLLVEAVRRKPVPPKYEAYVHAAGLIALFGLMLVVTFNDVLRMF